MQQRQLSTTIQLLLNVPPHAPYIPRKRRVANFRAFNKQTSRHPQNTCQACLTELVVADVVIPMELESIEQISTLYYSKRINLSLPISGSHIT